VIDLTDSKRNVVFYLQVVDPKGNPVRFNGGGAIEKELVSLVSEIVSQKIGMVSTKKGRRKVVEDALSEAITSLKRQTIKV